MKRVQTKRIYEEKQAADGSRVLVMRLWPRGVKKGKADLWLKELGPAVPVLRAWKAGTIAWGVFRQRYLAGLKGKEPREQLAQLRSLAAKRPITLLCACAEENRCHRKVLAGIL